MVEPEETIFQRSRRIYNLIKVHKTGEEISLELRSLLQINNFDLEIKVQDETSIIQLVLEKLDTECFKHILDCPSKKKESFFKTVEKYKKNAVSKFEEMEKMVQNYKSTSEMIQDKYICKLDMACLDIEDKEKLKNVRILKIEKCANVTEALNLVNKNSSKLFSHEKSYLFGLVLIGNFDSATLSNEDSVILGSIFQNERPAIVQIVPTITTIRTYFFEPKEKKTYEFWIQTRAHSEMFSKSDLTLLHFNDNLVQAMLSKVRNIVDKLTPSIMFQSGGVMSDWALSQSSSLCARFLMLFKKKASEDKWKSEALEQALKREEVATVFALLDLPFNPVDKELMLNEAERKVLKDSNLLETLILSNDVEKVKVFSKLIIFVSIKASNLCWKESRYDCLYELLTAEFCFPSEFDLKDIDSDRKEKFQNLVDRNKDFHDAVKSGNMKKLKEIVEANFQLKHVYNEKNQSALSIALISKQFDVFAFMKSEGFNEGEDHTFRKIFEDLQEDEKKTIKKANLTHFKSPESDILLTLTSKSQINEKTKKRDEYFKRIRKMYAELAKIDSVLPLMKAVANSKQLKIVFDFTKKSVVSMDPTTSRETTGVSYYITGYILIAAGEYEKDRDVVLGVLAHEIAHYAMYLIFENDCLPYFKDHKKNEVLYMEILRDVELCVNEKANEVDQIVSDVYNCELNKKELRAAELIVRVPQLLTKYRHNAEKLKSNKNLLSSLFNFYENEVLNHTGERFPIIKSKYSIKELNEKLGELSSMEKRFKNLEFIDETVNECKDLFLKKGKRSFCSETPTMLKVLIYQVVHSMHQEFTSQKCIFSQIRNFGNEGLVKEIESYFKSSLEPFLVINCTGSQSFCSGMKDFIMKTSEDAQKRIIVVIPKTEVESELEKLYKTEPSYHEINLRFEDFNKRTQRDLSDKKINFQDKEVTLRELQIQSKFKSFQLEKFITSENYEIGIPKRFTSFLKLDLLNIKRSFKKRQIYDRKKNFLEANHIRENSNDPMTASFNEKDFAAKDTRFANMNDDEDKYKFLQKDFEELIDDAEKEQIMIISDDAGTGKTETLKFIAKALKEKHSSRWVSVIDLKEFSQQFDQILKDKKELSYLYPTSFSQFFADIFLEKESFKSEVFMHMCENGKTIVLFDGLNEIKPEHRHLVLQLLENFKLGKTNQIWIATRSNLRDEIEDRLKTDSYRLNVLTFEEQKNLFIKFSTGRSNPKKAEKDFNKLYAVLPILSIGAPQLLKILSEKDIHEMNRNQEKKFLSLYSIYREIVVKKVVQLKGPFAEEEQRKTLTSSYPTNIIRIHEKLALRSLPHEIRKELNCEYNEEEWKEEAISLFGLLQINSEGVKFQHETYKEYFFAEYIVNKSKYNNKSNNKNNPNVEKNVLTLMANFMIHQKYRIPRTFLNDAMESEEPFEERHQEMFGKILDEQTAFEKILLIILKEKHGFLIEFTLNSLKFSSKDTRKRVFQAQCNGSKEFKSDFPLHLALQLQSESNMRKFFEVFKDTFNESELKKEFERCGKNSRNILHCCMMNREVKALSLIWNKFSNVLSKIVEVLLKLKDGHGDNVLHFLFLRDNELAWEDLLDHLNTEEFLTSGQFCDLMKEPNLYESKPIHLAILFQNSDFIKKLFKLMEKKLQYHRKKQKEIIRSLGYEDKNIFLCGATNMIDDEMIPVLITATANVLEKDEFKKLLQKKDSRNNNILQISRRQATIKHLLSKKIDFSYDENKSLFLDKNDRGQNVLLRAVEFRDASFVETFCDLIKKNFSVAHQKEIFTSVSAVEGNVGKNILHFAALNNQNAGIFKVLQEHVDKSDMKKLLKQVDAKNNSAFHCFHSNENDKSFGELFELSLTELSLDERKDLLLKKNSEDANFFHLLISNNDKSLVKYFCSNHERFLESDIWKELLMSRGSNNKTIFQSATANKIQDGTLKVLWESTSILSDDDRIKLLMNKSSNDFNVLHCLGLHRNEKTLKDLFDILRKSKMGASNIEKLLKQKNNEGNCCLHQVISTSKKTLITTLFEFTKGFFNEKDQTILFSQHGKDGKNIFHSAALNCENDGIFLTVWDCIKHLFDEKEVMKNFLSHKDIRGCTVLHSSLKNNSEKAFSELFSILGKNLDNAVLEVPLDFEIFSEKNKAGNNCLHLLLHHNSPKVFEKFMFLMSPLQTLLHKLFTSTGEKQRNIFHFAASNTHKEKNNEISDSMLKTLFDKVTDIISKQEVMQMLIAKDQEKNSILHHIASEEVFDKLHHLFVYEEFKELIFHKNNSEDSFLHKYFGQTGSDSVQQGKNLMLKVKKILKTQEDIRKLYDLKDSEGRTIQDLMSKNDKIVNVDSNSFIKLPEEQNERNFVLRY